MRKHAEGGIMRLKSEVILKISMFTQSLFWAILSIRLTSSQPFLWGNVFTSVFMLINGILFVILAFLYNRRSWLKILTAVFLAANLLTIVGSQLHFFEYTILTLNMISIASYSIATVKEIRHFT